ncbi:MAG: glycosyltransferase family 4 protein [Solirubrobacteraceae bacterium]|nr:glycosyltransferase family 4 protein [Solirubrobacteraceae bacterium]
MSREGSGLPAGVNVVGQFNSESGVGEAARALVSALDAAGIPVLPTLPIDASPSRQGAAFRTVPLGQATFPVTLSLLTAYETKPFLEAVPPSFLKGRRLVGLWWWEVELFPDFMAEAFAHVDAVWAGTRHIQDAFARTSGDTPVELIRYPVRTPKPSGDGGVRSRRELGLPEGSPLFLTVFGFYSSVARKNPQGTIAAFLKAFPTAEPGGPQLVVKAIDEGPHPDELAALEALVAPHPHVHIRTGYLDRSGMDDLLAAADVVVSLHRAEGFGYTPAEAMALGRPVIATGYSGNLDYMDSRSAVLIDAPLIPIGEDGGPYPPESRWADPDLGQAAEAMRLLARDPALRERLGAAGKADLAARFSAQAAGETMAAALRQLPPAPGGPGWLALRKARKRAAALRASR